MAQYGYGLTRRWPTIDPVSDGTMPNLDYWSQPTLGNMPLSRMVNLFGSLASAIAPNSVGGRMGRALSGMAEPYEQANLQRESLLDFARREAKAKAIQETDTQRRLGGLLGRLEGQRGGLRLYESPEPPPEGRVGMSLSGVEMPDVSPPVTAQDIAELYGLMGKEGAGALINHYRNLGRLPSEASAAIERSLTLARDPRLRGLVSPDAQWSFKGGEKGLTFETSQPAPPKPEYTLEYVFDPVSQSYVLAERQKGSPTIGYTRPLTPREYQEKVVPERKLRTLSEYEGVYEEPTAGQPGRFLIPPTPKPQELRGFSPETTVYDPNTGRTLFRTPPSIKTEEDTGTEREHARNVEAIATRMRSMGPESAREMVDQVRMLTPQFMPLYERAYQQAAKAAGWKGFWERRQEIETGVAQPAAPPPQSSLSGQRTSKPDGSYRLKNGEVVTVKGGVIQ